MQWWIPGRSSAFESEPGRKKEAPFDFRRRRFLRIWNDGASKETLRWLRRGIRTLFSCRRRLESFQLVTQSLRVCEKMGVVQADDRRTVPHQFRKGVHVHAGLEHL